jgi:hypothetical protein
VNRQRKPRKRDRIEGSPPALPFIAYLGGGLLALGIVFVGLVVVDVVQGQRRNDAVLALAGTLAAIGALFLLVAWGINRRDIRIWRSGYPAEATVTSVKATSFQVSGRYMEEPRWEIEYSYQDLSGHPRTGRSGYIPEHIAATWRVGDKGPIRVDDRDPAASVWIGRKVAGSHQPAPAVMGRPSFFKVAKRIPSFWTGPFVFVMGVVVAGVRGGNSGPLEGMSVSLCGVVLFIAGSRRIWIAHRVLKYGLPTDATVTSIRSSILGVRIIEWRNVIRYRYEDNRGQPHMAREYLPDAEAFAWHRGSRGRIRFDPRHPGHSVWMGNSDQTAQNPSSHNVGNKPRKLPVVLLSQCN